MKKNNKTAHKLKSNREVMGLLRKAHFESATLIRIELEKAPVSTNLVEFADWGTFI